MKKIKLEDFTFAGVFEGIMYEESIYNKSINPPYNVSPTATIKTVIINVSIAVAILGNVIIWI